MIFALARNNQEFAESVAAMVFQGVKMTDYYMNFFRLLTMLTELPGAGGPPGMPRTMVKVGDRVRVKPSVMTPQYKWGSVNHTSIGVVTSTSLNGRDLTVDFPMHR